MAGGWIAPYSVVAEDAVRISAGAVYSGTGGNAATHEQLTLRVQAPLDADAAATLLFLLPPVIPTGTAKLIFKLRAFATAGIAKFTVSDGQAAGGVDPSAPALTAETQTSQTWVGGNAGQHLEVKVPLTTVPVANSVLVVSVKFQTTGWTLLASLFADVQLGWE